MNPTDDKQLQRRLLRLERTPLDEADARAERLLRLAIAGWAAAAVLLAFLIWITLHEH